MKIEELAISINHEMDRCFDIYDKNVYLQTGDKVSGDFDTEVHEFLAHNNLTSIRATNLTYLLNSNRSVVDMVDIFNSSGFSVLP